METTLEAIDTREVARICGVTRRAARKWRQHRSWPTAVRRLLAIVIGGDMEAMAGRDWRGWQMVGGTLCGPDGAEWCSGRLGAWWIERQQIPELQRLVRELRAAGEPVSPAELERLRAAAAIAQRAAYELGQCYPRAADRAANHDTAPATPALHVR